MILGIIGWLCSFVPFYWVAAVLGIVGLILGLIGYGRFQRNEATNGAVALWGIITSAVAVILCLVGVVNFMIGSADQSDEPRWRPRAPARRRRKRRPPARRAESAEVNVYDLEVGDCVAEVAGGFTVQTVPCSEPRRGGIRRGPSRREWGLPGHEAIDVQAEELCTAEFEGFVGLPYEDSMLRMNFVIPSEERWDAGDRVVLARSTTRPARSAETSAAASASRAGESVTVIRGRMGHAGHGDARRVRAHVPRFRRPDEGGCRCLPRLSY